MIKQLNIIKNLRNRIFIHRKPIKNPTISVITPSYNQADFLPECLDSVASQTYKPIEHIVFDPGSTDGSREIAAAFPHVKLIAERDEGQGDAVSKGTAIAKGDIIAWINSDDCYYDSNIFQKIVSRFQQNDHPDVVYGKGIFTNENGEKLCDAYVNQNPKTLPWRLQQECGILQPALFFKKEVINKVGPISNNFHFCMDYEYWIRCTKKNIKFVFIDEYLAKAKYHINNKTYGMRQKSYQDVCEMVLKHFGYVNHHWLKRYAEYIVEGFDGVLQHSQNTEVSSQDTVVREYVKLIKHYNNNYNVYSVLKKNRNRKGYKETFREMKKLGISPQSM